MSCASRVSGVAPLSVFFDAVGPASGVVQPSGATPDYASFHYQWRFADRESGRWSISGRSKNRAIGYVAAHVFERPGSYRVQLRVVEANGVVRDYFQDITVLDPEQVYAGRTFYISSSAGNDNNDGLSPTTPFQSAARAMSALFASDGPRRVLFRRGETFPASSPFSVYSRTGPYTIGAYDTGANPVIRAVHAGEGLRLDHTVSDTRIVGVDFEGPLPSPAGGGVQLGRDSLLLRSTIRGFHVAVGGYDERCNNNTVAECALLNSYAYAMYYSPGYNPAGPDDPPIHLAILGNRFDGTVVNSLLRTYVSRSLWQGNEFLRAGQSTTRLLGINSPKKSEFNIISENHFKSLQTWILEIGPENDENGAGNGAPQIVENAIVENNRFSLPSPGAVSRFVLVWGSYVTVRNNIFDHTGANWGATLLVDRRGIGPVPVGVRIDNNTVYRGTYSPTFEVFEAHSQDQTLVRNNIAFGPLVSPVLATGTVLLQGNSTADPLFLDAQAGDFRLQTGSPAIDAGVALPLRQDFDGRRRPAGSSHDIGAFEKH